MLYFICDEFASELVVMFRNPQRKRKKRIIFYFSLTLEHTFKRLPKDNLTFPIQIFSFFYLK